METYNRIQELSKLLSSSLDDLTKCYQHSWNKSSELTKAISFDIENISGKKCFVESITFIHDNPEYRQSASLCIAEVRFETDRSLLLIVECIIDHSKVWLKIKKRPESQDLMPFVELIESKYNSEFNTELKELEKYFKE